MKKHVMMAAMILALGAGAADAAKWKTDVYRAGNYWGAAIKNTDCKGGEKCWVAFASYKTKKAARKRAKEEAAKANASGIMDGRTDGGLCGQPGVEC
ncbi:hypothetical protein KUV47_02240 [Vannielia litorea]|uniref:hypothetical protein n=1 Tax=Vannielia litorea TaxID=1217970 RepID=UPI001C95F06F|nr:hypothetical protein [Vannielia litorea]MBY6152019.1 hypothetical protein [Vannielia litorea]